MSAVPTYRFYLVDVEQGRTVPFVEELEDKPHVALRFAHIGGLQFAAVHDGETTGNAGRLGYGVGDEADERRLPAARWSPEEQRL